MTYSSRRPLPPLKKIVPSTVILHEQAKPSPQLVSGRPRQVSPSPLPSLAECLEAKAAGDRMYFGCYAGAGALHRALLRCFPDTLKDTDPYNISILWPALLYIRGTSGRDDLTLNMGIVTQRVKDQIPSIEEDVGNMPWSLVCFRWRRTLSRIELRKKVPTRSASCSGLRPSGGGFRKR